MLFIFKTRKGPLKTVSEQGWTRRCSCEGKALWGPESPSRSLRAGVRLQVPSPAPATEMLRLAGGP